jgi:muramoyltetrapeptide carboxypeptidase
MGNSNSRRGFIKKAGLGLGAATLASSFSNTFHVSTSDPTIVKPHPLKKGDLIAVIAPGGAVFKSSNIKRFESILTNLGFRVLNGKTLTARYGQFAGSDALRAQEMNEMFANPEVKGIITMRGGSGCARILSLLDYDLIRDNPKVFMGMSDITSLLISIYAKSGLVGFHGPVGYSSWERFTLEHFRHTVMEGKEVLMQNPSNNAGFYTINSGKARGQLMGGNLTVLTNMLGSNFLPDWKGKILFLEEINEETYRVDRMLNQLKMNGIFDQINGVIIGKFRNCEPEEADKSLSLEQAVKGYLEPIGKPAFYGSMIGHIKDKFTIPMGVEVEMDANTGNIRMLETATS